MKEPAPGQWAGGEALGLGGTESGGVLPTGFPWLSPSLGVCGQPCGSTQVWLKEKGPRSACLLSLLCHLLASPAHQSHREWREPLTVALPR